MKKSLQCIILVALAVVSAHAQSAGSLSPGAVQQQSNQTQKYYGQQKAIQQKKKPLNPGETIINKTEREGKTPSTGGPTFLLRKVDTNHSAILTSAEITGITSHYQGRKVSIGDLLKMVAKFNALYKKKGYITARAFLPPQKVSDGVVRVELVEGRVGRVTVTGNFHTHANYYTSRIGLKRGELIRTKPLEKKLVLFNQTNNTQLRAVLQAGSQFGTTNVDLKATEPTNFSSDFSFDNSGYDSLGKRRLGLVTTDRSLLGYRDALTVGSYWTDGTVAGFAQYEIPIGIEGARVGGGISYNHIDIRSGPLSKLGVRGHFWDFSINYDRPLLATRHTVLDVYLAPHDQRSVVQSRSFVISKAWARFFEFGDTIREYDDHGLMEWNNGFGAGVDRIVGRNTFVKYNGSFLRAQRLGRGFVAILRAMGQAQLSGVPGLAPSLEFQIGGISTVRGYPQGMLIGDNGYATSAELDTPVPFGNQNIYGKPLGQRLKLAFFVDNGGILQKQRNTFLTGVGGGFIVHLSRYLTGHFDLAGPLQNDSNIHHLAFEFYLESSPPWNRLFHRF